MMNTKERYKRGIFIGVIILFVLACSLPGRQTSIPPTTEAPNTITATLPASAPNAISSKTPTPTKPGLDPIVDFGAGGTQEPLITLTPELPDFDQIINFGEGGGGSGGCGKYPSNPNAILVDTVSVNRALLCVFLRNINTAIPIKIKLAQSDGTGKTLTSSDLVLDQIKKNVYWEGSTHIGGELDEWLADGSIKITIPVWWPITLSPGVWRFTVYQPGGLQAYRDFKIANQGSKSYINAMDARSEREVMPHYSIHKVLQLASDRKVKIAGINYPPNTLVYILLYHSKGGNKNEYELIEKKPITSDGLGMIVGELSGPFDAGHAYILYGITDAKAVLGGTGVACDQSFGKVVGLACDYFDIMSEAKEAKPAVSAIDKKYTALGGEKSFLGQPTENEQIAPDGVGHYRHFQGGSIYWSPNTGAFEVHGLIRAKWSQLGWEKSFLGYPVTDESTTPDGIGRYNHFQGGSIYWTPNTGAYEVHGSIRDKWAEMGWENSCLGYPISDEEPSNGGWERQSRFEHGIIKWSSSKGALPTCNGS